MKQTFMNQYSKILIVILFTCPLLNPTTSVNGDEWESVSVPSEQDFTGYAWYRTWFKPHGTFFSKHERDLYGESVILNIRSLAGAHEVFINGKQIGTGGEFPPDYQDGLQGNHRHKIPSGSLVPDQWNELSIRVYSPNGKGGFLSEAPFVMNYFWECVLKGKWDFQRENKSARLGGSLETKPTTTGFDQFHESNRVLGEANKLFHGEKLLPADSHAKMKAADDLLVELMLAEPLVAQPTYFSFDSRGRLWVAQYRQYPYPAGLQMISRDRYYRSHYDKTPPPPPHHDRGRDVISIHEDTTGDGKYDHHKIFQDGLNMANAAIRGRGGVWVMHTPYLLFYPDEDFDDVPDGPPVVHLSGFGMEDTHSVANGLVWGMDGWLYGAQGSTTSCHVTRPKIDPPNSPGVYFQGCMVWRYHPESQRFEIFSEGGGNNFGLEIDSGGRLFTGNNGGQTRGWHYMQGGLHLMQGTSPNKFGPVRNPFAFGDLPMMASEQPIPRFTHFATFVEATALPAKYQRTFFSVEPLHNFVIASQRQPRGATFKTNDLDKVLTSDDFAFRPVYIGNAPDGSVLVANFYEHYIAHGQHYQSQIDPTTGRIFRLRGKQEKTERDLNLHAKSTDQLIDLLRHPNRWHRHTAVRLLGERKDPSSAIKLQQLVVSGEHQESLNALWALYQGFGLDQKTALDALGHESPLIRYWTVRFICDDVGFANKRNQVGLIDSLGANPSKAARVPENLYPTILALAANEKNAEVRSQLAGSARRLPPDQAISLVSALLKHREDIDDPYLPLLCWWVIEANLDRERDAVMALFENPRFRREPMVIRHILARIMRSLALKGKNQDLQHCARLLKITTEKNQMDKLLKGFEQAYVGRRMVGLPSNLANSLVNSGQSSLELRVRLGDVQAIREAIGLLQKETLPSVDRIAITRTLGEVKPDESLQPLLDLSLTASDSALQRAALTAVSAFSAPEIGERLLGNHSRFPDEVLPAFFDLMLCRNVWTRQLTESIAAGKIDPSVIPRDVADRLRTHPDAPIATAAKQHLGKSEQSQALDFQQRIQQVRDILANGTGNPYAGEATFKKQCATCHRLFHKGGNIGPDLTPYQRGNLDTLLTSVITPNIEIREGFEYVTIETSEGRLLSGFVTDQDTQIVTLRGKAGEDIRIQRKEVDAITPVGRSLMPTGLLDEMTNQELRDFFAYLRISQPISH